MKSEAFPDASEERYRHLFEINPLPMWVYDAGTYAFLAVNESAMEKYGYSRSEFMGMKTSDIGPCAKNGNTQHRRKDGTLIEVDLTCHALPFEGRAACLVAANDITEKKEIERQLLRMQRMESIGTLAGGIAHDLNNVLAPILMAIQLLRERFPEESNHELLEILGTSAKRGAGIVRQLYSFARGVEGERTPIQLKHLLAGLEQVVSRTFPDSIAIRVDAPRNLWLILGDSTQVGQVFLNLCMNARDAMPQGGTLTVAAENVFLDEHFAQLNLEAKTGMYVAVEISDSGTGISPGIADKIFEPFFTTKGIGEGAGLGLSTVRAIVKGHGGFVNVYSEVGNGTKVKVYLPSVESGPDEEIKALMGGETGESNTNTMPHAAVHDGRSRTVLVVDDEKAIRDITQVTLESRHYKVITARDGAEAVSRYARNVNDIAVVLLDMMMPVMDGFATIRALRSINPRVRIIAASGLLDAARITALSSDAGDDGSCVRAILSKPYTAEKLLRTLNDVMEES